jgi:predicted RNA-binding protein with PIN domain
MEGKMISYIIDGNNLIGKIKSLMNLQSKDKQASREKLVFILDRYFAGKKNSITLHFDGYPKEKINSSKMKFIYSDDITADEKIKRQIDKSSQRKNINVITSDSNLANYARICSCKVISSEDFVKMINTMNREDDEESRIKQLNNDEFIKLFKAK